MPTGVVSFHSVLIIYSIKIQVSMASILMLKISRVMEINKGMGSRTEVSDKQNIVQT